jgi:hypothetical protein
MIVLRITRHAPSQAQLAALKGVYGADTTIITTNATIRNVKDVKRLIKGYQADVIEVVLPLQLLEKVVQNVNIPVIRSVTIRHGNNSLLFSHYEQIHSIVAKTTVLKEGDHCAKTKPTTTGSTQTTLQPGTV